MDKELQTNNFSQRKRNKVIMIIVSILLLLCLTYILVFDIKPRIEQKYYGQGYFNGQASVVNTINNAKEIPIIVGEGNNTNIKWYSIDEVCNR